MFRKKEIRKSKYSYDENEEKTIWEEILDFVKVFAITAIVITLFVNFIAYPVRVQGRSMYPTLADGNLGFTNIISLSMSEPQRGDVVVVELDDPETGEKTHWVKRIIGQPGDTVECINGQVYVNDELLDESAYIDPEYEQQMIDEFGTFNSNFDAVTLGEDEYFVMGDNRPYSKDSRYAEVGPITKDQIFGKGVMVYFPFSNFGSH